jgi:hypothetical protein
VALVLLSLIDHCIGAGLRPVESARCYLNGGAAGAAGGGAGGAGAGAGGAGGSGAGRGVAQPASQPSPAPPPDRLLAPAQVGARLAHWQNAALSLVAW